ncbi:Clp protease N-terminal domain-containing protein [Prauserella muralis]|uniref:ATPase n=1 Tax=Prauserella muralis TaxID=588067 RepID=A0A2V4BA69_9PSEU|nr:Clp protease N-terminal domain-containing protein [Prauserella muralis]PXY31951.1 ATPase [Prauserella muralis]TWE13623.1 ClpA/ClpB-like protein [Prauserella muralis]
MFEQFTKDARATVREAVRDATELGSAEVDTLHVLVALTRFPQGAAARLLGGLGVALDDVAARAQLARRRGGLSDADAEALGGLGIDVDHIVSRIEQEHGPHALAGGGRRARGHIPFGEQPKRVLERCLREVIMLGDRRIGSEHILLALAVVPGPARDVLSGLGVSAEAVRAVLRRAS